MTVRYQVGEWYWYCLRCDSRTVNKLGERCSCGAAEGDGAHEVCEVTAIDGDSITLHHTRKEVGR